MPALTRRREIERQQETWHVYYRDTCIGTIGERAGVPHEVDQWGWRVGFYPIDHRPEVRSPSGTDKTFEQVRNAFDAAWHGYLPGCSEADFAENRRHQAATAWKYRMHDTGTPLPTQMTSGLSMCFCGAALTIASVDDHIRQAHMDMA